MYKRPEFTRSKYFKVKCPYCQSNSNLLSENSDLQMRKCKAGHYFAYFKILQGQQIFDTSQNDTNINEINVCDYKEESTSAIVTVSKVDKQDRIKMVYTTGDKKAIRI